MEGWRDGGMEGLMIQGCGVRVGNNGLLMYLDESVDAARGSGVKCGAAALGSVCEAINGCRELRAEISPGEGIIQA